MDILLDLHVHSDDTLCARGDLTSWRAEAHKKGLHGIAVTDVETLRSRDEADDFLIIPGIEYRTEYGRVLGLFMEEQPRMPEYQRKGDRSWVFNNTIKAIKQAGGIAVMAQPINADSNDRTTFSAGKASRFRQDYPSAWSDCVLGEELFLYFDAWEVCNSRYDYADVTADKEGSISDRFRQALNSSDLIRIAGSDAYYPEEIGTSGVTVQVPDNFWQLSYHERLTAVREALLKEKTVCKGSPVHESFVLQREYDLQKTHGKLRINPRLWLKCRKAAREYRRRSNG